MVDYKLLLEFDAIFPEEDINLYLSKIKEIPSKYIVDFVSTFLRHRANDKEIADNQTLLSIWFRKENEEYANILYDKILKYEKDSKQNVLIVNEFTNLLILEAGLGNSTKELQISESEFEILFFKIYLAFNTKSIENESVAGSSTEKLDFPYRVNALLVSHTLKYSDTTEYNLKDTYVIQLVKATYFFEEFASNESFKPLLNFFYEYYSVKDYKEYIKSYLALSTLVFNAENKGKIEITISTDVNTEKADNFLEKFSLPDIIEDDIDFKLLRTQPIHKISDNKYIIIFPLFVIEKLFNGLYFKLKEFNDHLEENEKVKGLKSEIAYNFSEKQLCYKLLERSFGKKYIQKTGESIEKAGIIGFVDYYVRNGNKVFLFESKDILINADAKQSYDFNIIEKELIKKLYKEEAPGKIAPKAVLQLINSIRILLDGKFSVDENYKPNSIRIYPVIILHSRQLEVLGLNQIVKTWFKTELSKLAKELYKIDKIQELVIMNIDSLIIYSDQIIDNTIKLEDAFDSFSEYTDQEKLQVRKFKDEQQRNEYYRNSCISFSDYLRKTHEWKYPKIIEEKGYSLFS